MKDKKYLDKVLGYMVKVTKMDYENKEVNTPFYSPSLLPLPLSFSFFFSQPFYDTTSFSFSSYCKNTFGLTDDEMEYVWKEYRNIINDKIENGE